MLADDIDRFLDASAAGDDVLGDDKLLAFGNGEAASQDQPAILFFDKDVPFA